MRKLHKPFHLLSAVAGASVLLALGASAVSAQTLTRFGSCLTGHVDGLDYAEISANLREAEEDRRAGVTLESETTQMTVQVTDLNGESVCEQTANMSTNCRFRLGSYDQLIIRIDNTQHGMASGYKICPY
jgi:hypothetical protein